MNPSTTAPKKAITDILKAALEAKLAEGTSMYRISKDTKLTNQQVKGIMTGNKHYTTETLITLDIYLGTGIFNENIYTDLELVTD